MRPNVTPADLQLLGIGADAAGELAISVNAALNRHIGRPDPEEQLRLWHDFRQVLLGNPTWRWSFDAHRVLHGLAYEDRRPEDGPGPAWAPTPEESRVSNVGKLMSERGFLRYAELHAWSARHREDFWSAMVRKLGIVFRRRPDRMLGSQAEPTHPQWFPGAEMNIAESCFLADRDRVAVVSAEEGSPDLRRLTYGQLYQLCGQVANGLSVLGIPTKGRVALYLPMSPESVAIYLGVVLAGRCVVGIADTAAPPDLMKRLQIGDAGLVFTVDSYVRAGKQQPIYRKVIEAHGPRAVVLPADTTGTPRIGRPEDLTWTDFLGDGRNFEAVSCRPSDYTNILFSSGTTKDPKAVPWTHTTPIKSATDAYLHHDVQEADILAWPTSFGWMMGPWLTYASLVNRAAMALYVGDPQRREYGEFLSRAGATIVGVVPKLVRSWKMRRTMEHLDWSQIRLFSSTAEPSTPEEMLYLMSLAGYKPVIEYCGGTEVGGGYLTGTVVQPCAPSTFTTPALGLDFMVLDDGTAATRGEVFLVPPSIGLSNELLNYDHFQEYFAGAPRGPHGEILRRHGDKVERLPGGYYRHLGRIDDMINIGGVKTSAEEIRSVITHDLVYDAKPAAVTPAGGGQHSLVVYVVLRDETVVDTAELRESLRRDFERAIRERLNPLLAHVHDVVIVPELPQAGPGKTRTTRELAADYRSRTRP